MQFRSELSGLLRYCLSGLISQKELIISLLFGIFSLFRYLSFFILRWILFAEILLLLLLSQSSVFVALEFLIVVIGILLLIEKFLYNSFPLPQGACLDVLHPIIDWSSYNQYRVIMLLENVYVFCTYLPPPLILYIRC